MKKTFEEYDPFANMNYFSPFSGRQLSHAYDELAFYNISAFQN